MLNQPAYVRYNSVVTAAQWQQLNNYVRWQLWERPTVVVANVISYSSSRQFNTSTTPTVGGEIYFSNVSEVNYTNLATCTNYNGTSATYGCGPRTTVAYDNSLTIQLPSEQTAEPLAPIGNSSTAYCLAARTAAIVTRYMGRLEGV